MNDFRDVARRPNVKFSDADAGASGGDAPAIVGFRVMSEPIAKGEELLASYGKGFWEARGLLEQRSVSGGGGGGGAGGGGDSGGVGVSAMVPRALKMFCRLEHVHTGRLLVFLVLLSAVMLSSQGALRTTVCGRFREAKIRTPEGACFVERAGSAFSRSTLMTFTCTRGAAARDAYCQRDYCNALVSNPQRRLFKC